MEEKNNIWRIKPNQLWIIRLMFVAGIIGTSSFFTYAYFEFYDMYFKLQENTQDPVLYITLVFPLFGMAFLLSISGAVATSHCEQEGAKVYKQKKDDIALMEYFTMLTAEYSKDDEIKLTPLSDRQIFAMTLLKTYMEKMKDAHKKI